MKYTFEQLDVILRNEMQTSDELFEDGDSHAQYLASEMRPEYRELLASKGFFVDHDGIRIEGDVLAVLEDVEALAMLASECIDIADDDERAEACDQCFVVTDSDVDYHGGYVLELCEAFGLLFAKQS